jgi:hypothetical protein
VLLGLIDLNILLERMDEVLAEILRRNGAVADLAQGNDRIFVVVAPNGDLRTGRDHSGAVSRHQHEVEAVVDLLDAVFNGDAGHERLQAKWEGSRGSYIRTT